MLNQYSRTELIMGKQAMERIRSSRIAVFGVGGVGGYVVEALARCGVGTLDLIDHDTVSLTNLNRQIIALHPTIGKYKVDAAEERVHDIDPEIRVNKYRCFYLPEEKERFDFTAYDFIVDAIDTVTAKIDIILEAQRLGVPVISSMGCGNRLDPTKIRIKDLYDTEGDPLAKIMRRELKKRGVKKLKVCCSEELPVKPSLQMREEYLTDASPQEKARRSLPGSTAFVPAAAGLATASYVIRQITDSK